jgi:23S rRNA pseudouridine955/2504/2580 synthase
MAINAQGKNAVTKFKVLESFSQVSLLEVEIETGRTHQIRLHLASIGHPVTCDNKYGDKKFNEEFQKKTGLTRQFLHAQTLKIDGKTYTSPLPQDLQVTLGQL